MICCLCLKCKGKFFLDICLKYRVKFIFINNRKENNFLGNENLSMCKF